MSSIPCIPKVEQDLLAIDRARSLQHRAVVIGITTLVASFDDPLHHAGARAIDRTKLAHPQPPVAPRLEIAAAQPSRRSCLALDSD